MLSSPEFSGKGILSRFNIEYQSPVANLFDDISAFDGIKICAGRLADKNLLNHLEPFKVANDNGRFISIDLADGDEQTEMMQKIIEMFPDHLASYDGGYDDYMRLKEEIVAPIKEEKKPSGVLVRGPIKRLIQMSMIHTISILCFGIKKIML